MTPDCLALPADHHGPKPRVAKCPHRIGDLG